MYLLTISIYLSPQFTIDPFRCLLSFSSIPFSLVLASPILLKKTNSIKPKPSSPVIAPTNSSQSDTLHNHFCKEQNKDSFYSGFVLKSIITIACTYLGMSGWWGGHWVVNPVSAFCLHFVCIKVLCLHLSASISGISH